MRKTWLAVLLGATLAGPAPLAFPAKAEPPPVVASIQPLHSLAANVMKGVAEPALLVTGAASEHGYVLKPSDARALQAAGLVVLVDESHESFLAKPLKTLGRQAELVAMARLPGAVRLPLREGGVWAGDEHDHGHGHAEKDFDGHLWLDPANARLLVERLAERLAALDPANAAAYTANSAATMARLAALDAELRATLAPVAARPYVVFHDAYHYFETRYGLSPAGSVTVDPDRPPSAKRMAALRDRLKGAGAACVFREPQFPAKAAETLAASAGARLGVLDPQGATLPPGPEHYFQLMRGLAASLSECLSAR